MKKNLFFPCAAAALLALSVFAGCSNDTPSSVVSSEPVSSVVSSSPSSQADPSDFDVIFNKNPIDPDHQEDRNNAMSTMDMLEVEERYTEVWKQEIESGYEKLLDAAPAEDQEAIEREQGVWNTNLPAELDKIAEESEANIGTMASVQTAVRIQELYRSRAQEIYRSLYRYDPDFTYHYSTN